LILDEPTNDLDLETLDLLQEVIADYAGTVLIVSHDRDFLDRTVTAVVVLDGSGKADVVAGGYSDWEAKRDGVALLARSPAAQAKAAATSGPRKSVKLTYIEQRELDGLPAEIETMTKMIATAEAALADPALYARDPKKFDRINIEADATRKKQAKAEERWLELSAKVEALAG
jgi:ATP-binding cassette subfamily F protein uup